MGKSPLFKLQKCNLFSHFTESKATLRSHTETSFSHSLKPKILSFLNLVIKSAPCMVKVVLVFILLCYFDYDFECTIGQSSLIPLHDTVQHPLHVCCCWSLTSSAYGFHYSHLSNLWGASRQDRGARGFGGPGKFSCRSSWRTLNHKWHGGSTADLTLMHAEVRSISETISSSLWIKGHSWKCAMKAVMWYLFQSSTHFTLWGRRKKLDNFCSQITYCQALKYAKTHSSLHLQWFLWLLACVALGTEDGEWLISSWLKVEDELYSSCNMHV